MDNFFDLDPCAMAALSSAVGIGIADGLSADENNILGNFIIAVGSIIVVVAAQQQTLADRAQAIQDAIDAEAQKEKDKATSEVRKKAEEQANKGTVKSYSRPFRELDNARV